MSKSDWHGDLVWIPFAIIWGIFAGASGYARGDGTQQLAGPASSRAPLAVAVDFAGGSGEVTEIDQAARVIRLVPTSHKDRGWVCWWYVKVTGLVPGEAITLDVGEAPWATPDRAAVSVDNVQWSQTDPGTRSGNRIAYTFTPQSDVAWLAWGPPFVPDDAKKLVAEAAKGRTFATAFELCKSRGGRSVPALRITERAAGDDSVYGIWVHARQHAWEAGSSWVCRGFLEWIVSDDDRAAALRRKAVITVVPIMDVDNTAIGAGGKNELPHDHNRDWSEAPHWPAVAAAQASIKEQNGAGQFDLFVDLHNPGAGSKHPFYYVTPRELLSESGKRNLESFLTVSKLEMTGPLVFKGDTQESGANYDKNWKRISKNWVTFNTADHVVALTLETAWNTPHSTTEGYTVLGRQLGLAIERYLRESPRRP